MSLCKPKLQVYISTDTGRHSFCCTKLGHAFVNPAKAEAKARSTPNAHIQTGNRVVWTPQQGWTPQF